VLLAQEGADPARRSRSSVPFSAGGRRRYARLLAEKLRASFGLIINVDNKEGGSGMIGAVATVRAPADGYTLLMATAGETAINPHVHKNNMQYSPDKDLVLITFLDKIPNVAVVNPNLHLAGESLQQLSGTPFAHVPYRGDSIKLTGTASGILDMRFCLSGAKPFMKDGRVRAIAMTSPTRPPLAPELPAVAETKGLRKASRSRTG
jgi:tripartite-type tricarboxylate transporter receptor subunit TctC